MAALCALSAKYGETMGEREEGIPVPEERDHSDALLDTIKSLIMHP